MRSSSVRLLRVHLLCPVICAIVSAILFALPAGADAATTTFRPAADSYVTSAASATNYGTASQLKVDGSPTIRTYQRFAVDGLTEPVKRATLRLYSHSATGTGVSVHGVSSNSWGETTLTYANAPAIGAIVAGSGSFSAGSWVSIDVTSLVAGNGTLSVALTTTSTNSKTFKAKRAPPLASRWANPSG